jgi:hypothetical protein
MVQQGQVFELTRRGRGGERLWAYRYRTGGRGSRRVQRGGFASEQDAQDALERELERVRRERRISRSLTLAELVETYLAQHDVQPVTIALRAHGPQPAQDKDLRQMDGNSSTTRLRTPPLRCLRLRIFCDTLCCYWICVSMHNPPGALFRSKGARNPQSHSDDILASANLGLVPLYLDNVSKVRSQIVGGNGG